METKRKLYIAAAVLIVLVVALGLLTACTSESLVAYEAPAVGTAPTSYTLTVQASKGEAVTKALILNDENTPQESLDAVWMKSETIDVYKGETKVGELTPQEDNVSHTLLKGEVSDVAVDDELTLKFLSPDYATQDGTLDYIAANCDYATASVTVLGIDGTDVTTTGADFENQQSIVKFTLQDKNNSNAAISATEMMVVADGNTYAIHSATVSNEFFVALPSFSEKDIEVTAFNGSDIYSFVKESITIERGKYYTLTMQMDKLVGNLVNLSTLEGNYTAQDGDILTGTIDHTKKISIAAGASITLKDASINANGTHSGNTGWAGITCVGNATITLVGTNELNGCFDFYPGIQAGDAGTTLTISGTGSLTATGGDNGAGIGSGYDGTCGNISITGGHVTATGSNGAAGIGSGPEGSCGNISISGGTITATGGNYAAGIGSGSQGSCGNISISGGTINATGGNFAAGIGSGGDGTCSEINISGGDITATGGDYATGIGSGQYATCGDITISGTASGTASGGIGYYGIGPGNAGTCGTISVQPNTISGSYYVPPTLASCTFTVNFQTSGVPLKTSKIDITCNGKTYTALSTDEVNTNIPTGSEVKVDLPIGTNLSLTFTAECTVFNGTASAGTYSCTLTGVTITEGSENNLGTVNLVKQ